LDTTIFDGVVWNKLNSGAANLYNVDGILLNNRTVVQNDKTLAFKGSSVNAFSVDENTLSVDAANHRLGIGTSAPTAKVDINGNLKIRDTEFLSASNVSPLFVDANGLIGKSTAPSDTKVAFYSSRFTILNANAGSALLNSINNGDLQVVPILSQHQIINTLAGTTVTNNVLNIKEEGYYQIGGGINFSLTLAKDQRFFVAINIQKSTDNGSTWTSISGIRPIIISAATTATPVLINYPQVISSVIEKLTPNDLLRMVYYRTKASEILQGDSATALGISSISDYGILSYTFSISKL